MYTGLVIDVVGRGCWVIEQDQTRDCIWVHQRHVKGRKFLHVRDRVKFNIIPDLRKPNAVMADEVEIIGLMVARQISGTEVQS
jgi:hypothetical protein